MRSTPDVAWQAGECDSLMEETLFGESVRREFRKRQNQARSVATCRSEGPIHMVANLPGPVAGFLWTGLAISAKYALSTGTIALECREASGPPAGFSS